MGKQLSNLLQKLLERADLFLPSSFGESVCAISMSQWALKKTPCNGWAAGGKEMRGILILGYF